MLKTTEKEGGCLLVVKRCHKEVTFGTLILWGLTVASVCEPIKCLSGGIVEQMAECICCRSLWPGTLMNSSENWPIFAVTQHLPHLILWAYFSKDGKRCDEMRWCRPENDSRDFLKVQFQRHDCINWFTLKKTLLCLSVFLRCCQVLCSGVPWMHSRIKRKRRSMTIQAKMERRFKSQFSDDPHQK